MESNTCMERLEKLCTVYPCSSVWDSSSVWDPQSILLQDELEKVQKRAARFVTGNYVDYETGSMTGILKNLKWESLKKRRKDSRLIMLYKGLKGAASIPTNDLVPRSESESELFTGDTSKDNHSPGPVFREVSP